MSETTNPYAPPHTDSEAAVDPARLVVPASIAIACCVVSLLLWAGVLFMSLPSGGPSEPPLVEVLAFAGVFMVLPGLGLAGAISTLQRKRYRLSLIGAMCFLLPLIGPCFGLALPVGVWLLALLAREPMRQVFRPAQQPSSPNPDNADDAIAAAARLERLGDWHTAIAAYRQAAERWPEHEKYLENCIAQIKNKQAAAE
jgi:hypothetical protein